jgi:hypothetical protein
MALIDVMTVQAFYASELSGAGIMLAVVVLSMALITMTVIHVIVGAQQGVVSTRPAAPADHTPSVDATIKGTSIRAEQVQQGAVPARFVAALQLSILGILVVAALVFVVLFDPMMTPLLNPMMMRQSSALDIAVIVLSLLAWGGGVVFFITRDAWSPVTSQPRDSRPLTEAQKS